MNAPSIRRSLLARCGISVGALLCLLSAGTYLLVRQSLYQEMDDTIKETAALLANQVELENGHITFEWQEGLGTNNSLTSDGLFQFWEDKSGATTRSPALHFRDLPRFTGIQGRPLLRNIILANDRRARAIGLRIYPFVLPEEQTRMQAEGRVIDPHFMPFTLVVARDNEATHQTLDLLRNILLTGTLLILGLVFLIIHRAINSSLRPINLLSAQVQDRSNHQLDAALDLPEQLPVELKGLAQNFDTLLARLSTTRQREKDFIRHAAHELRTPIAGLRATTDLALSQPRDASAYATHLAACQKTAVELGELVKRLSALARLEKASPVSIEKINVQAAFAAAGDLFKGRLLERGMDFAVDPPSSSLEVSADSTLLRIILHNLLDNAFSYASSGPIALTCEHREDIVEIHVTNPIDDFPAEPERLFEPLFRRETSRHDAASHLGIGLTLSQNAAQAMAGTLEVHRHGENTIRFTLSLPVG